MPVPASTQLLHKTPFKLSQTKAPQASEAPHSTSKGAECRHLDRSDCFDSILLTVRGMPTDADNLCFHSCVLYRQPPILSNSYLNPRSLANDITNRITLLFMELPRNGGNVIQELTVHCPQRELVDGTGRARTSTVTSPEYLRLGWEA